MMAFQVPHQQAIEFLATRIDYERTQSMPCSEEAFKLDRMRELFHRLDDPQDRVPIIHVAGTKGKGSTAAMMAAILSASGRRVGLFTSPHLDRIEERIVLDGRPCSTDELAEIIERIRPEIEAMDRQAARRVPPELGPTYFEILTAAALCHFVRRKADAAVLEVGLGGRLDSTNVCTPRVSIITSISFDHTRQLGATLAAIAGEKAGIIKQGVPVVSGVVEAEPREVIRRIARQNGCRLVELGVDFDFEYHPPRHLEASASPAHFDFRYHNYDIINNNNSRGLTAPGESSENDEIEKSHGISRSVPLLHRSSAGAHSLPKHCLFQAVAHASGECGLVPAVSQTLHWVCWGAIRRPTRPWPSRPSKNCNATACRSPRRRFDADWPKFAGRGASRCSARRPVVVLDAAHNVASIAALIETLAESFSVARRLLIFATTREKDVRGMLRHILRHFDHVIFTQYLNNPRSVPPEELQALAAASISPLPSDGRGAGGEGGHFSPLPPTGEGSGVRAAISPLSRPTGEGPGVRAACSSEAFTPPTTEIAATPADAWAAAGRLARPDDLVCVTGSFFLAAEMRRHIVARPLGLA